MTPSPPPPENAPQAAEEPRLEQLLREGLERVPREMPTWEVNWTMLRVSLLYAAFVAVVSATVQAIDVALRTGFGATPLSQSPVREMVWVVLGQSFSLLFMVSYIRTHLLALRQDRRYETVTDSKVVVWFATSTGLALAAIAPAALLAVAIQIPAKMAIEAAGSLSVYQAEFYSDCVAAAFGWPVGLALGWWLLTWSDEDVDDASAETPGERRLRSLWQFSLAALLLATAAAALLLALARAAGWELLGLTPFLIAAGVRTHWALLRLERHGLATGWLDIVRWFADSLFKMAFVAMFVLLASCPVGILLPGLIFAQALDHFLLAAGFGFILWVGVWTGWCLLCFSETHSGLFATPLLRERWEDKPKQES